MPKQPLLKIGEHYSRSDLYELFTVAHNERGGNWLTGYHKYKGEWFVFVGVGIPGRTGHGYGNEWLGNRLHWRGKTRSRLGQPAVDDVVSGNHPVRVFWRSNARAPFTYAGLARAIEVQDTVPVTVVWGFDGPQAERRRRAPRSLSRDEIERRLRELERSPQLDSADLRPGAMCYDPAPPPDYWVYVCPACGRRTAYFEGPDPGWRRQAPSRDERADGEHWDGERAVPGGGTADGMSRLDQALSLARKLPKWSKVSLDESALCAFCRPNADEYWPVLAVELPGEAPRRLLLNLEDVRVLRAFLKESDRYHDSFDRVCPVRDEVGRLRHLLLGEARPSGEDDEE